MGNAKKKKDKQWSKKQHIKLKILSNLIDAIMPWLNRLQNMILIWTCFTLNYFLIPFLENMDGRVVTIVHIRLQTQHN